MEEALEDCKLSLEKLIDETQGSKAGVGDLGGEEKFDDLSVLWSTCTLLE